MAENFFSKFPALYRSPSCTMDNYKFNFAAFALKLLEALKKGSFTRSEPEDFTQIVGIH